MKTLHTFRHHNHYQNHHHYHYYHNIIIIIIILIVIIIFIVVVVSLFLFIDLFVSICPCFASLPINLTACISVYLFENFLFLPPPIYPLLLVLHLNPPKPQAAFPDSFFHISLPVISSLPASLVLSHQSYALPQTLL